MVGTGMVRAISQMNPTISRAMEVTTIFLFFPLALMDRYRLHSLICPFQAISSTSFVNPSCRQAILLLTRAGKRYAQAPSMSTRRPLDVPALVIRPLMILSPDECSEGDSPR